MSHNIIDIESLDMEARGVGHLQNEDGTPGKVIFVEGALPGERVSFQSYRKKAKWEAATLTALHSESVLRVKPKCAYFGLCGGCAMQHVEPSAQVAIKQRVLEDNLKHIGKVKAETMLRPIHGPTWGYRYRARIAVRNVSKKGGVLVGFHEKKSTFITDMKTCEVLPPNVSAMLVPLRHLIASLSIVDKVPQIELAVGQGDGVQITAMVLRIMAPLDADDEAKLKAFADEHKVQWWLQPNGPEGAYQFYPTAGSVTAGNAQPTESRVQNSNAQPTNGSAPLSSALPLVGCALPLVAEENVTRGNATPRPTPQPTDTRLHYALPEFGITMPFKPTDFTQVNHQINRVLVARALRLLDVQPNERIADLFCGLGNFTLPIATRARQVIGIEGSATLIERASRNAQENGLADKTVFHCRDLFEATTKDFIKLGKFDRILIDPPREGAMAICQALNGLVKTRPELLPGRIVYVSCNPATLARDAALLVHEAGYILKQAGVVNMFPHTAHVESIAVFERRL